MSDYFYTTREVKSLASRLMMGGGTSFDSWLNEELAKAWDQGQQSGAQWGVSEWADEESITSENPYRKDTP